MVTELSDGREEELHHRMGSGERTMGELCRSFGIWYATAYRLTRRHQEYGRAGLKQISRAVRRVWNRTPEDLEKAVVDLRRSRPRRGALKLLARLREQFPRRALPAASTIEASLKRDGLVKKQRRVRWIQEVHPVFVDRGPKEIWSLDFKGS